MELTRKENHTCVPYVRYVYVDLCAFYSEFYIAISFDCKLNTIAVSDVTFERYPLDVETEFVKVEFNI